MLTYADLKVVPMLSLCLRDDELREEEAGLIGGGEDAEDSVGACCCTGGGLYIILYYICVLIQRVLLSICCCRWAQQDPHTTIYTCVLITVGAVAGAVADALQNITPDELFGDQGQRGYTEGVTEEEERVGHAADKFAAAERLKGGAKLEEGGRPTWPSTHEEGQVRGAQGPEEASPKPR